MFHHVNKTHTVVIDERDVVIRTTKRLCLLWATHIRVNDFQFHRCTFTTGLKSFSCLFTFCARNACRSQFVSLQIDVICYCRQIVDFVNARMSQSTMRNVWNHLCHQNLFFPSNWGVSILNWRSCSWSCVSKHPNQYTNHRLCCEQSVQRTSHSVHSMVLIHRFCLCVSRICFGNDLISRTHNTLCCFLTFVVSRFFCSTTHC